MAWLEELNLKSPPASKEWAGMCKRNQARWEAHTTGETYVLDIVNRTTGHKFRVHEKGKNVFQAALRYYKGLEGDSETWKCTKIINASLYQIDYSKHYKVLTR